MLDVYRGCWVEADIGVIEGRIACLDKVEREAERVLDASGRCIVPGFFEPHFHAGGSHLTPAHLARSLLERGTTSTVCDFEEHYTVAGVSAARVALDQALAAGLRVYYLVPLQQFVVRQLGVCGHSMAVEDMIEMLDWDETVAINEPPLSAVLTKDPALLSVIAAALQARLVYAGHAPESGGPELQAYASTGASSDHESADKVAAWSKLGLGMKVIMRQGSGAPDLPQLVGLARTQPAATRHFSFGTDEVDPVDLSSFGHQDGKIRYAISRGVDPIVAFQMATINPAEYYRVDHEVGSLAPGRHADMVVLSDVSSVAIDFIVASGEPLPAEPPTPLPASAPVKSSVRFGRSLEARDFVVRAEGRPRQEVRVVEVTGTSLVSGAGAASLAVVNDSVDPDPARDILKAAVIDRYSGSARMGLAFMSGFGFRDGAVATTYQHPFFNVLVVGTSDAALVLAANRIAELGGGIAVVDGSTVARDWQLGEVGVFADGPLAHVRQEFEAVNNAIRALGCPFHAPILALAFSALPTIPAYGLSPTGLYDVVAGQFVSPLLEGGTG